MVEFLALAQQCAPAVHPHTLAALARVESGFNPYAIGVVGGRLERQPRNSAEAVLTAQALERAGYNFSLGVGQVNRHNLARYGLTYATAFEACGNLRVASLILKDCFDRARQRGMAEQAALHAAFSCYYSGNFVTGFRQDLKGQPSYVQRVLNSAANGAAVAATPIRVLPAGGAARPARASASGPRDATMVYGGGPRDDAPVRLTAAVQEAPAATELVYR
ncbi:lytic transglycosylase domain-containing protein [[Empedobacter] haloabium]|uniref:Lytic transglycosylase domain-containing protein n=1 Tax=[Empedobacter] haloabium TaxID=592317 RepID=A0ABZ1UM96_9BURK